MVPAAIIILIIAAALTVWIISDRRAREQRIRSLEDAVAEMRKALRRGGLLDYRNTF